MSDSILGIGTFGFLWVLLGDVHKAKQSLASALSRSGAKFSYTLYVAHTPILIFLVSLLARDSRWIHTAKSGILALAVLVIILAYVWLLGATTELRTDQLRAWIEVKIPVQKGNNI